MKKGAIDSDTLVGWIIALVVLFIALGSYFYLKDYGGSTLDFIKDLLRFGR